MQLEDLFLQAPICHKVDTFWASNIKLCKVLDTQIYPTEFAFYYDNALFLQTPICRKVDTFEWFWVISEPKLHDKSFILIIECFWWFSFASIEFKCHQETYSDRLEAFWHSLGRLQFSSLVGLKCGLYLVLCHNDNALFSCNQMTFFCKRPFAIKWTLFEPPTSNFEKGCMCKATNLPHLAF